MPLAPYLKPKVKTMPTLYLIEQNTYLRQSGDRLLLCRRPQKISKRSATPKVDDILLDLPCADVDHVMLFGNIQVTTQALRKMLGQGIELALFSFSGRLLGQLTPPQTKNIPLRLAQFAQHQNDDFKLMLAKSIVDTKLQNAVKMIRQHRKNHPEFVSLEEIKTLEQFGEKANACETADSLLGVEGAGTAMYFKFFGRMLKPPWQFETRTRRPPKDPVNAVLSFGYVVVGAEIQALLDGVGFDPYLGFYHCVDYGRPGLALDMLEEFRHPLVDRLALTLFNLKILTEEDFVEYAKGGIYLNTSGKRKFFQQYEKMLGELASATDTDRTARGFRTVFQDQIEKMMKAVQEGIAYEPFTVSYR